MSPARSIPPYALWLDLETTGTNERTGNIIEIGMVLTHTDPGFREVARWQHVVHDAPVAVLRAKMSPEVVAMHEANGLLAELDETRLSDRERVVGPCTVSVVEEEARLWLDRWTDGAGVALAGSGVAHFDSRWLREHMPRLRARLTYWAFDVGSVRRFGRVAGVTVGLPEAKDHRALGDALLHAEEARAWVLLLARASASIEVAS